MDSTPFSSFTALPCDKGLTYREKNPPARHPVLTVYSTDSSVFRPTETGLKWGKNDQNHEKKEQINSINDPNDRKTGNMGSRKLTPERWSLGCQSDTSGMDGDPGF
jgi:hypothetical protein